MKELGLLGLSIVGDTAKGMAMTKRIMIWRLKWRNWWYWNRPVRCWQCRRIVRNKYAQLRKHTVAGWVELCEDCDARLHSFDGGE